MKFKKKQIPYVTLPEAKICSVTKGDYSGYKPCKIELDVEDLVLERGNYTSNRTILYLQGGPNVALADGRNDIRPEGDHFYNQFKDDQFLHVKEIQHLKYQIGTSTTPISLGDAHKEQAEYMDILERIVKHYKNKDREVILIGYSYGALLVNEFLRTKGTIADKTYSVAGRLKCVEEAYSKYTPVQMCFFDKKNECSRLINIKDNPNNIAFLAVSLVTKDQVKEINTDMVDKNKVCFVSVEMDEQVGWFEPYEIKWAQENANLIYVTKKELKGFVKHEQSAGRIPKMIRTNKFLLNCGHYVMLFNVELIQKWLYAI